MTGRERTCSEIAKLSSGHQYGFGKDEPLSHSAVFNKYQCRAQATVILCRYTPPSAPNQTDADCSPTKAPLFANAGPTTVPGYANKALQA